MTSEARQRRRLEQYAAAAAFDAATQLLDRWQAEQPAALEPALLRARVLMLQGRYRASRDVALAAIGELRCPAQLALETIHCLRDFAAHDALLDWADRFDARGGMPARDLALAAASLSTIGASELALAWVDEALAREPTDTICRVNRALILSYLGRVDEAEAELEQVIDSGQDAAMAHWLLARLRRQSPGHDHVDRLRARLSWTSLLDADRAHLQFALFKELDDLGIIDQAYAALDAGCTLMQRQQPYDASAERRQADAIIAAFPVARTHTAPTAGGPVPIFIVGMHRSGTTLLERLLNASDEVCAYGESQRLLAAIRYAADRRWEPANDARLYQCAGELDFALLGEHFVGEGRRRIGTSRFATEKTPGNFKHIGFIRHALPQAKVLHLRRDPVDLCFANLRELFADGVNHSYRQQDVAHYHGEYQRLMQHWRDNYPGFVLDVDYEALVRDPVGQSQRVFAFCGLDWTPDVIDLVSQRDGAVNTLSALQVRQPVHATSIGRWRPYAHHLQPLLRALGINRNDGA